MESRKRPGKSAFSLNTVDRDGRRLWVYPADVRGKWRRLRTAVQLALVVFLLALPWVKMGGVQAFHLDIPGRHFTIFGNVFFAHDAPLIVFLIAGGALSLGIVTAVFGRVWCGWTCPQTVFLDGVVRRLERWIEGDAVVRKRRDAGPMTLDKFFRKLLKWSALTTIVVFITHSVMAFFIGTERLAHMMVAPPGEHPLEFTLMCVVSGLMLFDLGWFREQFCTLICPYGRFQSVLMDPKSLAVAYDSKRGEPRRGTATGVSAPGDCIDCGRCVAVCPTGIDVRSGFQQLECIACTACADACDEIMLKVSKPPGLIRYASLNELEGKVAVRTVRPWVYAAVLVLIFSGVSYAVMHRVPFRVTVLRPSGGLPYEVVQEQTEVVVNRFKADLANRTGQTVHVSLKVSQGEVVSPLLPAELRAGESKEIHFFVKMPKSSFQQGHLEEHFIFEFTNASGAVTAIPEEVRLVGPF